MILPKTIDNGFHLAPLTRGNNSMLSVLETAKNLAKEKFQHFAKSPNFTAEMELIFGQGLNFTHYQAAWAAGEINFPSIQICSGTEIGGAWGMFVKATGQIYLIHDLLENEPLDRVVAVLLEEYSKFVDAELHTVALPEDEDLLCLELTESSWWS